MLLRLTLSLTLSCGSAAAQCQLQKLTSSSPAPFEFFGEAAAFDGETIAVGVPRGAVSPFFTSGSVDVFERGAGGFAAAAELAPPVPQNAEHFGAAVDVDDDTVVVGAPSRDVNGTNSGAAFVFARDAGGWALEATLAPAAVGPFQRFGTSVAVSGDTIAVGSPYTGVGGTVFVFERQGGTWVERAALSAAIALDANMGSSVALADDLLVTGAPREDLNGHDAGAAFVFRRAAGSWGLEATLVASDGTGREDFGRTVATDGATLVVGAPQDGVGVFDGAAYVFEPSGAAWVEAAKLLPDDMQPVDYFARSVAIDGDAILCGVRADSAGFDTGPAFLFERGAGGWARAARVAADDTAVGDSFGSAVALAQGIAIVAASAHDAAGNGAGAAYVFDTATGRSVRFCPSAVNSSGASARLSMEGPLEIGAPDTYLVADHAPPAVWGLFVYGQPASGLALGDGTLCISPFAPGIFRLLPALQTDTLGVARRQLDHAALPAAGAITGGSTWAFQFWFRDAAAQGTGSNLTDAVRVTFCGG